MYIAQPNLGLIIWQFLSKAFDIKIRMYRTELTFGIFIRLSFVKNEFSILIATECYEVFAQNIDTKHYIIYKIDRAMILTNNQ
jgi:hypothetical protein